MDVDDKCRCRHSGAQRDWLVEEAVSWMGIPGVKKGRKNFLGRRAWPGSPRSREVRRGVKGGENSERQPGEWWGAARSQGGTW